MAFSANEAAFEGFRIVRREPGTIVIWGVLHLAIGLGSAFLVVPFMGPFMQLAQLQPGTARLDAAHMTALLLSAARFYAVILPLGLIVAAIFTCAVYRTVLRPADKGLARLKIGADELRLVVVWVVLGTIVITSIFRPDLSSVKAYLSPGRTAYIVFNAFLSAIYSTVAAAPAAAAYRALTETSPSNRAEVFE